MTYAEDAESVKKLEAQLNKQSKNMLDLSGHDFTKYGNDLGTI
jgi:hypothetical protein